MERSNNVESVGTNFVGVESTAVRKGIVIQEAPVGAPVVKLGDEGWLRILGAFSPKSPESKYAFHIVGMISSGKDESYKQSAVSVYIMPKVSKQDKEYLAGFIFPAESGLSQSYTIFANSKDGVATFSAGDAWAQAEAETQKAPAKKEEALI